MEKDKMYYRSLLSTENLSTGNITYFMIIRGNPYRISKDDFERYKQDACELSFQFTESTKKYCRQYVTCNYNAL